jgi:hypothetical protein
MIHQALSAHRPWLMHGEREASSYRGGGGGGGKQTGGAVYLTMESSFTLLGLLRAPKH